MLEGDRFKPAQFGTIQPMPESRTLTIPSKRKRRTVRLRPRSTAAGTAASVG
jgi:hypothetical protein